VAASADVPVRSKKGSAWPKINGSTVRARGDRSNCGRPDRLDEIIADFFWKGPGPDRRMRCCAGRPNQARPAGNQSPGLNRVGGLFRAKAGQRWQKASSIRTDPRQITVHDLLAAYAAATPGQA